MGKHHLDKLSYFVFEKRHLLKRWPNCIENVLKPKMIFDCIGIALKGSISHYVIFTTQVCFMLDLFPTSHGTFPYKRGRTFKL